jgi:NAD(P)-dependent dehydrogenase (short-subunit alcohol dehydrogenase family)
MSRVENKVAVVTGATSGIGLATVKRFVAEGAFVYEAKTIQASAALGPQPPTHGTCRV